MLKSMTGYGKAEAILSDKKITVEIKSLNSKQLDLSVRIPSPYRNIENEIRNRAAKILQRGKADIFIMVENSSSQSRSRIDSKLFSYYLSDIRDIAAREGADIFTGAGVSGIIPGILRLPDVVSNNTEEISQQEINTLYETLDSALAAIDTFRTAEARSLGNDLLLRVKNIITLLQAVEPYEKDRIGAIRQRITENIESLNIPYDANRLEQELIYYVEKLDITEEKVRLANHCRYFEEVALSEDAAGRKLGFISQEMGREINTLGSKANDSSIQKIVVDMKDELEKIKEQLLNIL